MRQILFFPQRPIENLGSNSFCGSFEKKKNLTQQNPNYSVLRNPLNTHIGATDLFVVPVKISSILLQSLHLKSLTRSIYQFPLSFSSREVRTLDRITTSVQNLHLVLVERSGNPLSFFGSSECETPLL
ncbi:hypothetical protein QL285_032157 [Trifolium repens]|nr:hypothetical protein QL285_032157 [Trifolium repens]